MSYQYGDTNCGPGMVYDTPEDKEIAQAKQIIALRAALAERQEAIDELVAAYDSADADGIDAARKVLETK